MSKSLHQIRHFSLLLALIIASIAVIRAERAPIKVFTSADGMASSAVTHIMRDSQGFLWFSTRDGVSRFDGREFTNYRLKDQLAVQGTFYMFESSKGVYWITSGDGLYRVTKQNSSIVKPLSSTQLFDRRPVLNTVKATSAYFYMLYEDQAGNLWGAGSSGLFKIEDKGEQEAEITRIELWKSQFGNSAPVVSLTGGDDGSLWVGSGAGISRRLPDGRIYNYPIPVSSERDNTNGLAFDRNGNLWVAHDSGFFVLKPESLEELKGINTFDASTKTIKDVAVNAAGNFPDPEAVGQLYKINFGDFSGEVSRQNAQIGVYGIFKSKSGVIWFADRTSLFAFNGEKFEQQTSIINLPISARSIAEDSSGNIWLGANSGAYRLARQGLTTFDQDDGLNMPIIMSIQESKTGDLWVVHDNWAVSRFTGKSFERRQLPMPPDARIIWASTAAFLDDSGDWWALAENGLYQFSDFKLKKIYTTADGLKSNKLFCAYQDKQGNIWFSSRKSSQESGLSVFDKKSGKFRTFTEADGFPNGKAAQSFAEDSAGNVWISFYESGLVRYRNGRFDNFSDNEAMPKSSTMPSLHIDHWGRLWIASASEGLIFTENPEAEKPTFKRFSTADGLSSNNIRRIIEDGKGNIYLGSGQGIDRLNPETRQVRHYSTADGLASDFITAAYTDKTGALWFGTQNGLSRLNSIDDLPQPAPKVFIDSLQIAGMRYAVSEFGQESVEDIDVSSSENNMQINFASIGDNLRYQYRLEGTEDNWSDLSYQRNVNYANLGSGSYKFLVRAVNSAGFISEHPATVSFTIHPPFWRTWYFIVAMLLAAATGVFILDRYRVAKTQQVRTALEALRRNREERLKELEKVRTRIATDLHDDIGASLTHITVLSEVARSQSTPASEGSIQHLDRISVISNELVETMSDIVWAINPRKDQLRDLTKRMRRFGADVLSARHVKFDFHTPPLDDDFELGANVRREVFAIFKESINNAVKHSECTRVEASFEITPRLLRLSISDNGKGFDTERSIHESYASGMGGNGLINIQRRGTDLNGKCEVISFEGGGTTVLLEIPLQSEETN